MSFALIQYNRDDLIFLVEKMPMFLTRKHMSLRLKNVVVYRRRKHYRRITGKEIKVLTLVCNS